MKVDELLKRLQGYAGNRHYEYEVEIEESSLIIYRVQRMHIDEIKVDP